MWIKREGTVYFEEGTIRHKAKPEKPDHPKWYIPYPQCHIETNPEWAKELNHYQAQLQLYETISNALDVEKPPKKDYDRPMQIYNQAKQTLIKFTFINGKIQTTKLK